MKYKMTVEEFLSKSVEVEAKDKEDAWNKVVDMWESGELEFADCDNVHIRCCDIDEL